MSQVEVIPIELGDGLVLMAEARVPATAGESEIVSMDKTLDAVTDAVRRVGEGLVDAMKAIGPKKFTIQLGFDLTVKEGQLVALLVSGSGTASIKVTLEWERSAAPAKPAE